MHVGEYVLALVGIVLGLAIADLALSTHRLIRRRADVKFSLVPIIAALIALGLVFLNFWGDYSRFKNLTRISLWEALPNLAILFLNFLIAASALPDEWEGKLDMWDYYLKNRRQFWVLIAIAGVVANLYNASDRWPPRLEDYEGIALTLAFAVPLCIFRSHWLHLLLSAGFLFILVATAGSQVISG